MHNAYAAVLGKRGNKALKPVLSGHAIVISEGDQLGLRRANPDVARRGQSFGG